MSRKGPRSFEPAPKTSQKTQNTSNREIPLPGIITNLIDIQSDPVKKENKKDRYGWIFDRIVALCVAIATAAGTYYIGVTDGTTRQGLRAFVGVREISDAPIGESQEKAGVTVHRISMLWENSGGTPTRYLRIFNNMQILGRDKDPPFPTFQGDGFKMTLAPKAIASFGGFTTTNEQFAIMRDGRADTKFFGLAIYEDVFGARHITMTCYNLYAASVDYTKRSTNSVVGRHCAEFNCTDEECKRYKDLPSLKEFLPYLE